MRWNLGMALLACGAALGCGNREPTAPRGGLIVTVSPTSIVGLRSPVDPVGGFAGEAVLRNTTARDLRVNACAPDLEREVKSGEWLTALLRYCTLQLDLSDIEVPALSEVALPWAVRAPFSGSGPAVTDADLTGRYRLVYRYGVEGDAGEMEEARSAPFDVTDR